MNFDDIRNEYGEHEAYRILVAVEALAKASEEIERTQISYNQRFELAMQKIEQSPLLVDQTI